MSDILINSEKGWDDFGIGIGLTSSRSLRARDSKGNMNAVSIPDGILRIGTSMQKLSEQLCTGRSYKMVGDGEAFGLKAEPGSVMYGTSNAPAITGWRFANEVDHLKLALDEIDEESGDNKYTPDMLKPRHVTPTKSDDAPELYSFDSNSFIAQKCLQASSDTAHYVLPSKAKYYKVSSSGQSSVSSSDDYYKMYSDHDGLYVPGFYELDSDSDYLVTEFDLGEKTQPIKRVLGRSRIKDIITNRVKDQGRHIRIKKKLAYIMIYHGTYYMKDTAEYKDTIAELSGWYEDVKYLHWTGGKVVPYSLNQLISVFEKEAKELGLEIVKGMGFSANWKIGPKPASPRYTGEIIFSAVPNISKIRFATLFAINQKYTSKNVKADAIRALDKWEEYARKNRSNPKSNWEFTYRDILAKYTNLEESTNWFVEAFGFDGEKGSVLKLRAYDAEYDEIKFNHELKSIGKSELATYKFSTLDPAKTSEYEYLQRAREIENSMRYRSDAAAVAINTSVRLRQEKEAKSYARANPAVSTANDSWSGGGRGSPYRGINFRQYENKPSFFQSVATFWESLFTADSYSDHHSGNRLPKKLNNAQIAFFSGWGK